MMASGLAVESRQLLTGEAFAFHAPEATAPIWGADGEVLAATLEPTLLVGPQGIGKTTLLQRFTLARVGIQFAPLLGLPVQVDSRPALYVAADRPMQARRSLRRMVGEEDREPLRERLVVWNGPLPFDVARDPEGLVTLATSLGVGTVVLDSLKDCAVDLVKDDVGSRVNRALQLVVGEGIEVIGAHHQRKASSDNRKPRKLDDVYGSVWLTAGCGSVVLLWGEPGDPVVELSHLKQPAVEVGPLKVAIDHDAGSVAVFEAADPLQILREAKSLTAAGMASRLYGTSGPTDAETGKARRKLERLVERGLALVETPNGTRDPRGHKLPKVYHAESFQGVMSG